VQRGQDNAVYMGCPGHRALIHPIVLASQCSALAQCLMSLLLLNSEFVLQLHLCFHYYHDVLFLISAVEVQLTLPMSRLYWIWDQVSHSFWVHVGSWGGCSLTHWKGETFRGWRLYSAQSLLLSEAKMIDHFFTWNDSPPPVSEQGSSTDSLTCICLLYGTYMSHIEFYFCKVSACECLCIFLSLVFSLLLIALLMCVLLLPYIKTFSLLYTQDSIDNFSHEYMG
jgi:hypothetical protein